MLSTRLCVAFRWIGDRTDPTFRADLTSWWRDPDLLGELGPALAGLFEHESPTVVLGPQSRGTLLGALVAAHLGVGLIEMRKDPEPAADSDAWLTVTTAPDYQDRHLELGLRASLLGAGDRVLFVDDWIATGAQAEAGRELVRIAGASWVGAAVVVDAAERRHLRRDLVLRSLLHLRDLR